ncbi:MAG TPA: patatin-like phospholipase family protein [Bryobacteraceae bacterium]|nr:patatin-like phospholipase family protein [Bryobacteraceae bacterium]
MPRRSLMLAGGGIKVAFQAGVLQVWLDEAGLEFDRADAVSAACFNLAMWVQGMSGTQIADNWRNAEPLSEVDINAPQLARLLYAASIFDLDAFRHKVFPAWKLDFSKISASPREATFNVYNFSKHELRAIPPSEMTEDFLVASASLPMWFPPVRIAGDTYIDAIFHMGSNIDQAIRAGADELWIIWTTSERGEWFDGFVGNFFGIFEATVVWSYKSALARIAANNAALKRGEPGEFGRPLAVREIKAEVPLHYLLNFSRDRAAEAVNRGVEAARAWCDEAGIPRRPGPVYAPVPQAQKIEIRFREALKGFIGFGAIEYQAGFDQGQQEGVSLALKFDIHIADLDQFLDLPEHTTELKGSVECENLGGSRPIDHGTLHLLVDRGDPAQKQVIYEIVFRDGSGDTVTLTATKNLTASSQEHASQEPTAVLATLRRSFEQKNAEEGNEDQATAVARGILKSGVLDAIELLASIRVDAPTVAARAHALTRFGAFYFGRLWDVYARHLLPVAPF